MKKYVVIAAILALMTSCATSAPDGVLNKVMTDFGLKEQPEGYVSGSDKVMEQLNTVGASEMKRMNIAEQHGVTKFQKLSDIKGVYYKEVKVYESYHPYDAQAVTGAASNSDRGYSGYIEYVYRVYQSERKDTTAAADAATADVPTDTMGRESYRYNFASGGTWNGGKGERIKK